MALSHLRNGPAGVLGLLWALSLPAAALVMADAAKSDAQTEKTPQDGATAPRERSSGQPSETPASPLAQVLSRRFGGVPLALWIVLLLVLATVVYGWRGFVGAGLLGGITTAGLVADSQADDSGSGSRRRDAGRSSGRRGGRIRTLADLPRAPAPS